MKIFILVLGTRGDLEPFLALGRELIDRGHAVLLGTSVFHGETVDKYRIPWVAVGNGAREQIASVQRSLIPIDSLAERTRQYYLRWMHPQLELAKNQLTGYGAQADYFISNLKLALRKNGNILPGVFVTYDPPAAPGDLQRYGGHRHGGRTLELVAMNAELLDPEQSWGPQFHFTGFWHRPDETGWTPPVPLAAFMAAGPPPVVVTMGSMAMFDADRVGTVIGQALRLSGQRAVVVSSWSGLGTADDSPPPEVFCLEEAPYDWLFPRAACVIHHGGSGTVAAVLRAGVPSILLPQILCQAQFAEILAKNDLAAGVFDVRAWQPEQLARAIRVAVEDQALRQSARDWQRIIQADPGVTAAAELIETHWRQVSQ